MMLVALGIPTDVHQAIGDFGVITMLYLLHVNGRLPAA